MPLSLSLSEVSERLEGLSRALRREWMSAGPNPQPPMFSVCILEPVRTRGEQPAQRIACHAWKVQRLWQRMVNDCESKPGGTSATSEAGSEMAGWCVGSSLPRQARCVVSLSHTL